MGSGGAAGRAPLGGLAETGSQDRRVRRRVLHRVDFAQQQGHIGVVQDRCYADGVGDAWFKGRDGGRRGRNRSCRHHQHAVQAHRPLDRRIGARLNQIGAGPQRRPSVGLRPAGSGFGHERSGTQALRRRCERLRADDRPGGAGLRRMGPRHRFPDRSAEAAAGQLPHDHQGGIDRRQGVFQGDAQGAARGDPDQRWLPGGAAGQLGQAVRGRAGGAADRAAGPAPHRNCLSVGQQGALPGRSEAHRRRGLGVGAACREQQRTGECSPDDACFNGPHDHPLTAFRR